MRTRRRQAWFGVAAAMVGLAACGADAPADGDAPAVASIDPAAPATRPRPTLPASSTTVPPTAVPPAAVPPTRPAPATTVARVDCLAGVPLRDQAALLTWPAASPATWERAIEVVRDQRVGGLLLMEPEGWDREELTARLAAVKALSPNGLLIATDEEGGAVQRLRGIEPLPSQQEVSESLGAEVATEMIADHGRVVHDLGVDVVLGPVVDVVPRSGPPPLTRSRFFTGDADRVAEYGGAYIAGWRESGILPVLKHFPGHGGASGDTHDEIGLTAPLAELRQWDLIPFGANAATGAAVMVGHLTVPDLTDGLPATLSPAAIDYLRENVAVGDALVISDALEMSAVPLSAPDAAVASIAAGVDVVLFTDISLTAQVVDALVTAVESGELPADRVHEAAARVRAAGAGCRG